MRMQQSPLVYVCHCTVFLGVLFFGLYSQTAFAADTGACGEPPVVVDEDLKGTIEGQANLLLKRLGNAQLTGQIETSRRDIFLKAPQGARAAADRAYFVAACNIIMQSSDSTDKKLEELKQVKQQFSDGIPTAGSVLGGWLHYAIGPCRKEGNDIVRCEGVLESHDSRDRALATFVEQTGGIRAIIFDKFGFITAIDNNSNNYKAIKIQVANKSNNETGQFGFKLLPDLPVHIIIDFNNVDSTATSFYRLTIPFADGGSSNGSKLDMVIPNIALVQ